MVPGGRSAERVRRTRERRAVGRLALAFARETARSSTARLCAACIEVLDVTGAGITIMGGDQAGPICVSNSSVAALEDLQFTIGEGPCRDAFQSRPVGACAQDSTRRSARWPAFVDLAQASGIGAVFAYPLLAPGVRVGVLTLYQRTEGELTAAQHDDSVAMAEVLTETVLSLQDDRPRRHAGGRSRRRRGVPGGDLSGIGNGGGPAVDPDGRSAAADPGPRLRQRPERRCGRRAHRRRGACAFPTTAADRQGGVTRCLMTRSLGPRPVKH